MLLKPGWCSRRHWLSVWQALAVLQHLEELELERAAVHGAIEVTNHSRPVLFFCACRILRFLTLALPYSRLRRCRPHWRVTST